MDEQFHYHYEPPDTDEVVNPTVDEFIALLNMECPCGDPICDGVWLSRPEAHALIRYLRKINHDAIS